MISTFEYSKIAIVRLANKSDYNSTTATTSSSSSGGESQQCKGAAADSVFRVDVNGKQTL